MFLSSLALSAGCAAPPEPFDPRSAEGQAIEAAICQDVDEGIARLEQATADPRMRDYFLLSTALHPRRGGHLLCPRIADPAMRAMCRERFNSGWRAHNHPSCGEPDPAAACPTLGADLLPDRADWCPCEGGPQRWKHHVEGSIREVHPDSARPALEEQARTRERVRQCYLERLGACPCLEGTISAEIAASDGRFREIHVLETSLGAVGDMARCQQPRILDEWVLPAGFTGSFTVDYRLWTEPCPAVQSGKATSKTSE